MDDYTEALETYQDEDDKFRRAYMDIREKYGEDRADRVSGEFFAEIAKEISKPLLIEDKRKD